MANALMTGKRVTDRTIVEEVRVTSSGSVITDNYQVSIARGQVTGAQPYGAYGSRTTTGAESNVLWPNGAYSFPAASGVQMSIVSTSANDADAGTGIRTMDIHYLDANLVEHIETVTLNGITPVLTVATNIRFIQCMHGLTFGSGKAAAGNISASNGGNTYSYIEAGRVRCSSSVRMVPAGKRVFVTSFYGGSISGNAGAATIIRLATTTYDGHDLTSVGVFFPLASGAFQDNSSGLTIPCPLAFTEGQTIGMTFTTDKASTIVGSWFGWLENV
jgi:hypothetical protein